MKVDYVLKQILVLDSFYFYLTCVFIFKRYVFWVGSCFFLQSAFPAFSLVWLSTVKTIVHSLSLK